MGTALGLIVFVCLAGGAAYLFVTKLHQDKKKSAAPPVPPAPAWKEETASNSAQANGDRSHFRFSHPGAFYGKDIEVRFDDIYTWTVADGAARTAQGSKLWKPISDNTGKLAILGDTGKVYKKCTIKFQG